MSLVLGTWLDVASLLCCKLRDAITQNPNSAVRKMMQCPTNGLLYRKVKPCGHKSAGCVSGRPPHSSSHPILKPTLSAAGSFSGESGSHLTFKENMVFVVCSCLHSCMHMCVCPSSDVSMTGRRKAQSVWMHNQYILSLSLCRAATKDRLSCCVLINLTSPASINGMLILKPLVTWWKGSFRDSSPSSLILKTHLASTGQAPWSI